MTRAFVLTGGGNLGAVQVGMMAGLREQGIVPDVLVGTSVGALNAAYIAGRGLTSGAVDDLRDVWMGVRRRDVFRFEPLRLALALAGRRSSLCSSDGLRRLIADTLTFRQLEQAAIPLHVTATNVLTGEDVCLDDGDAVTAVLASAAIPGIFPAVEVAGMMLSDGSVSDNAGISRAARLGAEDIWVLPTGYACALTRPPAGALASALHAVSMLSHQRLLHEVAEFTGRVDLHVVPPLCPVTVSPVDFTRTGELVSRSRLATRTWLEHGGDQLPDPGRFLAIHEHQHTTGAALIDHDSAGY